MARPNDNIIQDTKNTRVIDENGNILQEQQEESTKKIKKNEEPDFIKIYTDNLDLVDSVPPKALRILLELTKYIGYTDAKDLEDSQTLTLNKTIKDGIMAKLNIKQSVFRGYIKDLVDNNLIRKIGYNKYQINPKIIGKGYYEYRPQYKMGGIKDLLEYWEKGFPNTKVDDTHNETVSILESEEQKLREELKQLGEEQQKANLQRALNENRISAIKEQLDSLNPEIKEFKSNPSYEKIIDYGIPEGYNPDTDNPFGDMYLD